MKEKKQHRFSALVNARQTEHHLTARDVQKSVAGAVRWLEAATEATGRKGKCYRNALYHDDGRVTWMYPNSNTAELISAWLDSAEILGEDRLRDRAVEYADTLLQDAVHGLYRGPCEEAHGLPWYWTDIGTYSGLYAMRMPYHFDRLHALTGDSRYREICEVIGRTLLSRLLPSGIVTCAWNPQDGWIHEVRVGSRYLYAVATFATLWRITGEGAYREAYERALVALERLQNPDGSYFQMYDPRTGKPMDASIKMHFTSYLLNAIAEAYEVTSEPRLLTIACKLADHLAGLFYYRHAIPYCTGNVDNACDLTEADSSIQDSVGGLLWLKSQTGEPVYSDVARLLWSESWLHQISDEAEAGWAGAIIRGINPTQTQTLEGVAANRKHLHYDPTVIARCDLWFVVNHIMASRRLLNAIHGGDSAASNNMEPAGSVLSAL